MVYSNDLKRRENERKKTLRKVYTLKFRARAVVRAAVYRGVIIKPKNCSSCGKVGKIEAHHEDYNKPYDFKWLCSECHREVHRELFVKSGALRKDGVLALKP